MGKTDSYELLHHFLTEQPESKIGTSSPQSFTISLIKKQLHHTKQLQKKSSFARLPSARTAASSGAPSSSMRRGPSSKELNRSQKSLVSIRSNRQIPNFPLAPIQEQMQETDVLQSVQVEGPRNITFLKNKLSQPMNHNRPGEASLDGGKFSTALNESDDDLARHFPTGSRHASQTIQTQQASSSNNNKSLSQAQSL